MAAGAFIIVAGALVWWFGVEQRVGPAVETGNVDEIEAAAPAIAQLMDQAACEKAKTTNDKDSWESYLANYPTGSCADLAKSRLAKIEEKLASADLGRREAERLYREGNEALIAKKYKKAQKLLEKSLEHDPDNAQAHRSLGVVFTKLKKKTKAVEHYRTYLKLTPNAEDASGVRKLIKDLEKTQARSTQRGGYV